MDLACSIGQLAYRAEGGGRPADEAGNSTPINIPTAS